MRGEKYNVNILIFGLESKVSFMREEDMNRSWEGRERRSYIVLLGCDR